MKELEYIKLYFKKQFEKYGNIKLGFRYGYDSTTLTHIIEVTNEEIYSREDFSNDAFCFAMNFASMYDELVMFIKPSDPIKLSRIDYSENNSIDTEGYNNNGVYKISSSINAESIKKESIDWKAYLESMPYVQSVAEGNNNAAGCNSYALAA